MSSIPFAEPSLSSRAMLASLSISIWSARKHDPEASEEIALRHGVQTDAERYNKVLLPKKALADLQKIVSEAREAHYFVTLPWETTATGCFREQFIWTMPRGCAHSQTGSTLQWTSSAGNSRTWWPRPERGWEDCSATRTTQALMTFAASFPSPPKGDASTRCWRLSSRSE